ncbi:tetratricopeptide repeat protein [Companilactobacillus sp.]|jgi:tetratricopeptide (TPR) repeat protein|uniref:tetratricopeptide repeat protein n=1 Tax=Companilactobacillus sp. TaxID=2767905 RepID=UPI0025C2D1B6|nr:tetratricopeptide repeat protein [Companilactobacillus sp.]MCH4008429.1 tetratricopeptide repeat protein [Companilactobacillus sp.]MCH4051392.1 tetratricopeptide repeat protein [Companilactobacillus sp.]MCH4076372.1 tetratricopeptide repeat protein [Companilactobacillus sp.]MCH4124947.1 tetratricopeptide repeat protein [Companilactobacillus sp.]MCH4131489.1 tetratricopeptide repeat protein [Companilactobacillus sp.]
MSNPQEGKKRAHIQKLVARLNQNNRQLDVILELSANLVDVGDLEQAEELLARSLTLFPDNQDLIYNLGNVYFLADKYDRANELFDQLINKNYGAEAYFMKAKSLDEQGQKSLAIAFALTAVEKMPKDSAANELLADLLMANGNFESAQQYYSKVNEIKPSAKANFNLAICAMNLEQPYQDYLKQSKSLDEHYYVEHEKKLADLQKFLAKNGGSND